MEYNSEIQMIDACVMCLRRLIILGIPNHHLSHQILAGFESSPDNNAY